MESLWCNVRGEIIVLIDNVFIVLINNSGDINLVVIQALALALALALARARCKL